MKSRIVSIEYYTHCPACDHSFHGVLVPVNHYAGGIVECFNCYRTRTSEHGVIHAYSRWSSDPDTMHKIWEREMLDTKIEIII